MRNLLIYAIGICLLPFSAFSLDIVRDGKALAEIIVAKDAHEGEKRAAEDLAHFIFKMTFSVDLVAH